MKKTSHPLMVTYACASRRGGVSAGTQHAERTACRRGANRTVSMSVTSVGYSSMNVGSGAAIATRLGAALASYNGPEALHHVLAASRGVA
jgi:hypothetical protein